MTDTSPTTVNRTLLKRLPNSAYRVREYLTEKEVDRLIEAARKRGRNGVRDAAAILHRNSLTAKAALDFALDVVGKLTSAELRKIDAIART